MTMAPVYLIDDQQAVRDALAEMLRLFGYSVESFPSADAFLARARPRPRAASWPTCACPAWMASSWCASWRAAPRPPVVLISGHADVPMAVAAIKAGAEDFIEKPIDDTHLLAAINRCFARALDSLSRDQSLGDLRERFERLTPRESEVMDLVVEGFTQSGDCPQARHQPAHRRELSRANHGEDAGRERRRAGAPGHSPGPHRPVEIRPEGYQ